MTSLAEVIRLSQADAEKQSVIRPYMHVSEHTVRTDGNITVCSARQLSVEWNLKTNTNTKNNIQINIACVYHTRSIHHSHTHTVALASYQSLNPFKPSGAKWLHYKVFKAILV